MQKKEKLNITLGNKYFTTFKKGSFTAFFGLIKQLYQSNSITAATSKSFSIFPENKTKANMCTFGELIFILWQPSCTPKCLKEKFGGISDILLSHQTKMQSYVMVHEFSLMKNWKKKNNVKHWTKKNWEVLLEECTLAPEICHGPWLF